MELRVETGKWVGMKWEDRICAQCNSGEVEDVEHFLLRCSCVDNEREVLMKRMVELVDEFQDWWEKEKVVLILDGACDDGRAGRVVERV